MTLVARQEMEHMGLVLNLLTAIGGTPYFRRPNFPQREERYGKLGIKSELTRISQLNILRRWWDLSQGGKPIDRRAHQLTLQAYGWNVDINGTVHENKIGADENNTWPLSFWMGGWDGDALCAYISGYLSIPMAGGA